MSDTKKKCKGVAKSVVKRDLTLGDYRNTVTAGVEKRVTVPSIRSQNHTIHTQLQRRIALTPYDDKRYLLPGGIQSRSYGHYRNGVQIA